MLAILGLVLAAVVGAGVVVVMVMAARSKGKGEDGGGGGSGGSAMKRVILISLDGFRPDYLEGRVATPGLDALVAGGVSGEGMVPQYPSLTFPNHYSIVTGLHTESHGIIANTFFSPVLDAIFTISSHAAVSNAEWWGGEPIWVSAIKAGLRACVYFWPGSEAPIDGVFPTQFFRYNKSVPYFERVDTILGWVDLPRDETPEFIALYMSAVDSAGHYYGPDSPQVDEAIALVDSAIVRLMDGLDARGVLEETDIIVVSDHGMAAVSPSRALALSSFVNLTSTPPHQLPADSAVSENALPAVSGAALTLSPLLQFWPESEEDEILFYDAVHNRSPHLSLYRKDDLPARFFFNHTSRVPPIVGVLDLGWTLVASQEDIPSVSGGAHGYDPEFSQMHALFVASGPSFLPTQSLPAFSNVDVYPLLCHLLSIPPAPNNGTLTPFLPHLRP